MRLWLSALSRSRALKFWPKSGSELAARKLSGVISELSDADWIKLSRATSFKEVEAVGNFEVSVARQGTALHCRLVL